MGYLNIAGNAMYIESIPSSNLEEQGPGKMKARRPGSSRRLAPPPPSPAPRWSSTGLVRDAEICSQVPKHLAADLVPTEPHVIVLYTDA